MSLRMIELLYFTVIYYAWKARDGKQTFFGQTTQNIDWNTTSTEMPIETPSKQFSRLYNYDYKWPDNSSWNCWFDLM